MSAPAILPAMDQWGEGRYEDTAQQLAPVSNIAVSALDLAPGESVLDIGCGTGNAALVAHQAGALVTGIDASPRLLSVAGERVPGAAFVQGDASAMPFEDDQFDAAVSVFGVIFARPAEQTAAEIARVVHAGGRIAITTWPPRGPLFAAVSLMRQALARLRPPDSPPPFDWGDPALLESLLGPYGELDITEHQLAFEDTTPEEIMDRWDRMHPMWIAARRQLEPIGKWQALCEGTIAALRDSELGAGTSSPYLLAMLKPR